MMPFSCSTSINSCKIGICSHQGKIIIHTFRLYGVAGSDWMTQGDIGRLVPSTGEYNKP